MTAKVRADISTSRATSQALKGQLSPSSGNLSYHADVMVDRERLLLINGVINLILGIMLLIFPSSLVTFLGVPEPQISFYPNILGGVLLGIAIALFLESGNSEGTTSGLGLLGAVIINLCGGLVLGAWLSFGGLGLPLPGLIFLWGLVIILVGISCFELATRFCKDEQSI